MGKSQRLTLARVRAVGLLIGECREMGDNPVRWKRHLLEGLCRLVDAVYATVGELDSPGPSGPRMLAFDDLGGNPAQLQSWRAAMASGEFGINPVGPLVAALSGPCNTNRRRDVITDDVWYHSTFHDQWLAPTGMDDGILSLHDRPGGGTFMISPARAAGECGFTPRDARLVHFLHLELALHLGRSLATVEDPVSRLSPRLRQTLDCLLDGDGEKQAALRMGISTATVREYVQALYRVFQVTTRAELMAQFLRRHRGPSPTNPT